MKIARIVLPSLGSCSLMFASMCAFSCAPSAEAGERATIAKADATAHEKLVYRLFEQMGMAAQMEEMIKSPTMLAILRMNPQLPAGYVDELAKRQDINKLLDLLVPMYVKAYDEATLQATVAFGETEAGRKFLARDPKLMQQAREFGSQWATDSADALLEERGVK